MSSSFRIHSFANFNPRSRKGSDWFGSFQKIRPARISTHAPARGATALVLDGRQILHISTHAPARGATRWSSANSSTLRFQPTLPQGERPSTYSSIMQPLVFQPTLPQGERRFCPACRPRVSDISTHAPARGATVSGSAKLSGNTVFQPTLPQGERQT